MWSSGLDCQAGGGQAAGDQVGPVLDFLQLALDDADQAGSCPTPAPYYVVFNVDVRDALRYGKYMALVLPQIEAAGGKYLAHGGPHTVYEGDWSPYRLVLLQFPSREAFESFYHSPAYQDLHAMRDEVSYARLVGVEGLPSPAAAAAVTLAPPPATG